MTKEGERIMHEDRKKVSLDMGHNGLTRLLSPTDFPRLVGFIYVWDINTAEGKEHQNVYNQILLAGLKGAA